MFRLLLPFLFLLVLNAGVLAQSSIQKPGTKSASVQVLSDSFYMPQLKTFRKIWIYLPAGYTTTNKRYPVIYMQDAQNLFDEATAFSGEWGVDETLDSLAASGGQELIVVGIENGGNERLNEYAPWKNAQYGGGKGEAFAAFLADTLKPFVDRHYRTKRQAKYTAVAGSSMGGLISLYTGLKYPEKFGYMGIFSPSIWFAKRDLMYFVNSNRNKLRHSRMYIVAGKNESAEMQADIAELTNLLLQKGINPKNIRTKIDAYGVHNEAYWRGEFPAAVTWFLESKR